MEDSMKKAFSNCLIIDGNFFKLYPIEDDYFILQTDINKLKEQVNTSEIPVVSVSTYPAMVFNGQRFGYKFLGKLTDKKE